MSSEARTAGPAARSEDAVEVLVSRTEAALLALRSARGVGAVAEPAELLRRLEEVHRLVDALDARLVTEVETDGLWAIGGQRSFVSYLEANLGVSRKVAGVRVRRGRVLRDHLPATREAFERAAVSAEHVDLIACAATTSTLTLTALADEEAGEALLVRAAQQLTPAMTREVTRHWAARVDPEAEDRAYRERAARTEFALTPIDGGWHAQGWLDHESGTVVRTALDAIIGRPAAEDTRSRAQRDGAALVTMARDLLGAGDHQASARVRPHLLVHVPVEMVRRLAQTAAEAAATGAEVAGVEVAGVVEVAGGAGDEPEVTIGAAPPAAVAAGLEQASWADGTPMSVSQLARFACDGAWTRVVMGADGEPLDVGREKRIFTGAQTKALIARDRHCQFPGCHAPPGWCETHDTISWAAKGGRTSVELGVLLCWTHHRVVHNQRMTIHRFADRWEFVRPDGRAARTPRRGQGRLPLRVPPALHVPSPLRAPPEANGPPVDAPPETFPGATGAEEEWGRAG